jgi:hypothetical protein
MENGMVKSDQGGKRPVQTTHMIVGDQQTVSHLTGPLGIPGKLDKQMSVAHLAKPLGSNPSGGNSQSSPAPQPAPSNSGSQGGGKK